MKERKLHRDKHTGQSIIKRTNLMGSGNAIGAIRAKIGREGERERVKVRRRVRK